MPSSHVAAPAAPGAVATGFDFSDPAAQEYALWLCDEIDANAQDLSLESVECFARDFRSWRLARGQTFPAPADRFVGEAKEETEGSRGRGNSLSCKPHGQQRG